MGQWHNSDGSEGGCTGCDNGCSDCEADPDVVDVEDLTAEIGEETMADVVDGGLR